MKRSSYKTDQSNAQDRPTTIRTANKAKEESKQKRIDSKSLVQKKKMSAKNIPASNKRNLLQRYNQSYGHSIQSQVSTERQAQRKYLEQSLNRKSPQHRSQPNTNDSPGFSTRNIVHDVSRDTGYKVMPFDEDDDLLNELEDISSAQKELDNDMDELEKMFSLDSFGAVEEDIPSLSDDQNSTSNRNQSDSSEDHIMNNNASTDEKENPPDHNQDIDPPRESIANLSTRQLKVQTSAREFASVQTDPSVHTGNPKKCMRELNDHNEDIDCNEHESSAVIDSIACVVYGRHEYTIKLFWPDREGKSVDFTRTYEGGLLVYLSTWIFLSFFFGRVPHDIFWMAALIIPLMVITVEINFPHRMDEAVVALGILLCHFIFTGGVTVLT
uniref:Uncharacterized protein n=1 Tax=Ditylum brightwellii TaxID=49249 RepID=A0A7S4RHZ3_9STRA